MTSLQANNLAKDLLRFYRGIAACGGVASQNKGEPAAALFLYIHYAMGDERVLQAIKDNVSPFQVCRCYRLNRDHVAMANGWMHARSRGSETQSKAKPQQLSTKVAKMTKTRRRSPGVRLKIRFLHGINSLGNLELPSGLEPSRAFAGAGWVWQTAMHGIRAKASTGFAEGQDGTLGI